MSSKIKICGITNFKDALVSSELGADALGFVFAQSSRMIEPTTARKIIKVLPPFITTVGVFKDSPLEVVNQIIQFTGIDAVQLHGFEDEDYCRAIKSARVIKRIRICNNSNREEIVGQMEKYDVSAFVFDPGEGSGITFDWKIIAGIKGRIIVAGGLNCFNVRQVIDLLRPYGVDVCTGVEKEPGKKDSEKIERFIQEVRKCSLPV